MNRGNIILAGALVVLVGVYFLTRDRGSDGADVPAPRFFEINKETVDRIVFDAGWEKTKWVFARVAGDEWVLESAGGFPAKSETAQTFVDAVANLRKDNRTGTGEDVRKDTRTDDLGRLVRLEQSGNSVAEFIIGKTPPRTGQQYFVRKTDEDVIYRTRTLLTKDLADMGGPPSDNPWDRGPTGFRWDDYTSQLRDWVDTTIWKLGGEETQEVSLVRAGQYEVTITRKSAEVWELKKAGEDKTMPADTDVATGFADDLRYLTLTDVVGRYEQVVTEYGLDKPEITLVLTLKKKIEKKEEDKTEEKKDGDDKEKKEEKKKPKDEFKLGQLLRRPHRRNLRRRRETGREGEVRLPRRCRDPAPPAQGLLRTHPEGGEEG